jgi:hypothetical protein
MSEDSHAAIESRSMTNSAMHGELITNPENHLAAKSCQLAEE